MPDTEPPKLAFRQRPVTLLQSSGDKWRFVIFLSIYIPFFLIFFQPFGVNNYDPTNRISLEFLFITSLFGLVGGLILWVYEFLVAPHLFQRMTWPVFAVRLLIELILLASGFYLFYNILGGFHDWSLSSYWEFIRNVSIMGLIPIAIILLYLKYRNVRKAYEQAQSQPVPAPSGTQLVRLESDNGKEHIAVILDHLLYIEAQGNYVFVFHLENEQVKKSLLRTTMKTLEKKLQSLSVIRCHRSFLVNVSQVAKVTGNAHQLQLHLSQLSSTIPVSRSYIPTLEKYLDVHPV